MKTFCKSRIESPNEGKCANPNFVLGSIFFKICKSRSGSIGKINVCHISLTKPHQNFVFNEVLLATKN